MMIEQIVYFFYKWLEPDSFSGIVSNAQGSRKKGKPDVRNLNSILRKAVFKPMTKHLISEHCVKHDLLVYQIGVTILKSNFSVRQ